MIGNGHLRQFWLSEAKQAALSYRAWETYVNGREIAQSTQETEYINPGKNLA